MNPSLNQHTSQLFAPLTLRSVTLPHRLWLSPMCQYSSIEGLASHWHLVHLGARALGGAALVMTEAAAIDPAGRISLQDAGIWSDDHVAAWQPVTKTIAEFGAFSAIQLAHAGRKAATWAPFLGHGPLTADAGGWPVVGPSPLAFAPSWPEPHALTNAEILTIIEQFAAAALRSAAAGFDVVEIHAAHGYLLHQFLSPVSNQRRDGWGGDFAGRTRLLCDVVEAVRAVIPDGMPLLVRISATDWIPGGWDLPDSVLLARKLSPLGVDLLDVSSGGAGPQQRMTVGPGYQVPLARAIREQTGMPTAAVGLLTTAAACEDVVASGAADAVFVGRPFLRDPHFGLRIAQELEADIAWPPQYLRAKPF